MKASLPLRVTGEGVQFAVRVVPRASRTAIAGVLGDGDAAVLKIALAAPPVEGRANAALIEFLAETLGLPRSGVTIAAGEHARNKIVLVRGRTAAQVAASLERALGS